METPVNWIININNDYWESNRYELTGIKYEGLLSTILNTLYKLLLIISTKENTTKLNPQASAWGTNISGWCKLSCKGPMVHVNIPKFYEYRIFVQSI